MGNPIKVLRLALALAMLALLAGCQLLFIAKPSEPLCQPPACDGFSITGKIGVKSGQQGGSAFYTWVQRGDQFDIDLTGILGIGRTHIVGDKLQAVLSNSQGQWQGASASALLYDITGWRAPMGSLPYWVMAKPAPNTTVTKTNTNNLPVQMVEENWFIDLVYQENNNLPYKLTMVNGLDKVIITVNQR